MAKKKETKEDKPKKESSKEKECLIDLVTESSIPFYRIVMDLSRTGLDTQLEEEAELRRLGQSIEPTITKSEFNKIIGA
jgi:hypothetical protein